MVEPLEPSRDAIAASLPVIEESQEPMVGEPLSPPQQSDGPYPGEPYPNVLCSSEPYRDEPRLDEPYSDVPRSSGPRHEKARRRWPIVLLVLLVLLVAAAAVFYVVEWDDFRYVLGPSQEEKAADEQLALELSNCYAYNLLSEDDQAKYRLIMRAYRTGQSVAYPVNDVKDVDRIAFYVLADQALMPDVGEPKLGPGGWMTPAYVSISCYEDEDACVERLAGIEQAVDACLAELTDVADDYEKSKFAYVWVADHTDYDDSLLSESRHSIDMPLGSLPKDFGQTAGNVFLDGKAVCAGYARAFQYLMQRMGIECTYVLGDVFVDGVEEYHAWCLVKLDGEYYFVDPTWGDPAYYDSNEVYYTVNFDYLNTTTELISNTHAADDDLPLPECTSMADNYYVREGLYFETADRDRVGELFKQTTPGPTNTVFFMCANHDVYDDLCSFLDSGGLLDYANVDYHYFDIEENLVLGFFRDYE